MAVANIKNRRIKSNLTGFSLKTLEATPRLIVADTPGTATINLGIEERISNTVSQLGERVIDTIDVDAFQPVVAVTLPGWTPEAIAMRLGRKLETGSKTLYYQKTFRITATNQVLAAAESGEEGFEIVADEPNSQASYLADLGISTPLTRVANATFDPATDLLSYSVGAAGVISFSDDLIGGTVSFSIPYTVANTQFIGEEAFVDFEMNLTYIMRDLKIFQIRIPSVSISLGEGDLDLGAAEAPLSFRVTYDGSTCTPIEWYWIATARAC